MTDVAILETLPTVTLFGTRLFDPLRAEVLPAGMTVTLRQEHTGALGPVRQAFVTGSRVYAFRDLPGLRAFEQADPDTLAQSPVPRLPYVLHIRDPQRRFLPLALRLSLPLPYRGLFPRAATEPPDSLGGDRRFPLFSAPTRPVATWEASVQGVLIQTDGSPAAHAAIEVDFGDGLVHQGLADAAGRFAVPFAYPPAPDSAVVSPPTPLSLAETQWTYSLRVFRDPALQDLIQGTAIPGETDLPDHLGLLDQFAGPVADLFAIPPDQGGVAVPFLPGVLRRGQNSIARTAGLSTLVIQPNTSSP